MDAVELSGTWVVSVAIAVGTVLVVLYTLAALIRDRTRVDELKLRVRALRQRHAEEVQDVMMEEDESITRLAQEQFGGPVAGVEEGAAARAA